MLFQILAVNTNRMEKKTIEFTFNFTFQNCGYKMYYLRLIL